MKDYELTATAEQATLPNQVWIRCNDGRKVLLTFLEDVLNIYIETTTRVDISPKDVLDKKIKAMKK